MCKPTTDNDTTNGNNNGNVADDTVDNVSQEVTATKAQEEVHQVPPEEAEEEAAVGTPSTLSEEELEELETDEVYNKDEAEIEAETEEAEVADEEQDPQAIEKEDVATVATSTTTTTTTSSSTPAPADETVMAAKDVAVVAEEQELPVEEPEIDEDTKIFLQIVTTKANFGQGDEAACKVRAPLISLFCTVLQYYIFRREKASSFSMVILTLANDVPRGRFGTMPYPYIATCLFMYYGLHLNCCCISFLPTKLCKTNKRRARTEIVGRIF